MREFVSLVSLARGWKTDERLVHEAADKAGILLFTLHARAHADRKDLLRLGDALNRKSSEA